MNTFDKTLQRLKESKEIDVSSIFWDYQPIEVKAKYDPKYILLGRTRSGRKYYLDMTIPGQPNSGVRILVLGMTQVAGKTFLTKSIISRCVKSGYHVCIPTDVGSEYSSLAMPCNPRFTKSLPKGEKPEGLPIVSYYPLFLESIRGRKPKDDILFQFSIPDCELADLKTLLGLESEKGDKSTAVSNIAYMIKDGRIKTREDILNWIKKSNFHSSTKRSLDVAFRTLFSYDVLGDEYNFDIVSKLRDNIVALSMKGYERLGRSAFGYPASYVSILTRKIISAKEDEVLEGPIMIVFEESKRFIPNDGNPSSKQLIIESVDVTTKFGVNMMFLYQNYNDVPDEIFNQCRYVFINAVASPDDVKAIFRRKLAEYEWSPTWLNAIVEEIQDLSINRKSGEREWIICDTVTKDRETITPYPPFALHKK